ncbi:hypothetical protein SAMN05444920_102224 [Nonomuraea solani]|uniref:Uncharacterized protein n=1 Tax=Nonomuraea solani TaxID=1144553 RepID=A0A1H5YBQ4_9ACTN|nr:hypothetical protein [Nonomuraea solani]SEG21529.1 hypothetical protein SAMN05444920_102224 [Nonomuraea solani]
MSDHVVFEVEAIDRMLLHLYQPRLQYAPGVSIFLVVHCGNKYASSVPTSITTSRLMIWTWCGDFARGEAALLGCGNAPPTSR